jgi:hypothetical protein
MKKTIAALAALCAVHSLQAYESRFWDYYTPYPSNFIGSDEWWRGDSLTGDWWGHTQLDGQGHGHRIFRHLHHGSGRQSGRRDGTRLHLHRQHRVRREARSGKVGRMERGHFHHRGDRPQRHDPLAELHRQPIHRAADFRRPDHHPHRAASHPAPARRQDGS